MNFEKLHILVLSSWYPNDEKPFLGNFIKRQALLLSSQHNVTVINSIASKEKKKFQVIVNESYTEYRMFYKRSPNFIQNMRNENLEFRRILTHINAVDIIHAHILFNKARLFKIAKDHFNCPLVLTDQASYYRKKVEGWRGIYQTQIIKKYNKIADHFIAVSEFLWDDAKSIFGSVDHSVIPNHVDYNLFKLSENTNSTTRFIHISTLDPNFKDPTTLIMGVKHLVNEIQDFHLTIVSDENYSKWKKLAENLEITEYISFKGPLNLEDVAQEMSEHDAFILTSIYETFSIVLAEALASGLTVITTKVGIGKELGSEQALHFEIGNPVNLAECMHSYMQNSGRYSKVKNREFARKYDGQNVLKSLNSVYFKLLNRVG